jgi:methylated-DNA-protein-cysteine methyltransferase-like protein
VSAGAGRNERVWAVVSCIPRGHVATYGQVAALAGIEGPSGARQVGYALAALGDDRVPWHRVINARGTVSPRGRAGRVETQYQRLALEGVAADAVGRIDLARHGWDPGA